MNYHLIALQSKCCLFSHIGQCFHIHIFKACFYYISRNNQLSISCSFPICSRHQLECISTIALQHASKFGLFYHAFLQLMVDFFPCPERLQSSNSLYEFRINSRLQCCFLVHFPLSLWVGLFFFFVSSLCLVMESFGFSSLGLLGAMTPWKKGVYD